MEKNEKRAHGFTAGDMERIKSDANYGITKMIAANNCDTITDKHFKEDFKEGYKIPEHEDRFYHVAIESRTFNQNTGERLSNARVQVYDTTTFDMLMNMKPYNGFHGLTTHILHNPTKVAPKKKIEEPGTDDEYAHLKDAKSAKAAYKEITGNEPVRTWTRDKAVEAIKEFKTKK